MVMIKKTMKFRWGFYIPFEECSECSQRKICKKSSVNTKDELEYLTKRRKAIAEYIQMFFPVYTFPSPHDMCKELGVNLSRFNSDGSGNYENYIFFVDNDRFNLIQIRKIPVDIEEAMYKEIKENGKISLIIKLLDAIKPKSKLDDPAYG
jgi:hypothetical protein